MGSTKIPLCFFCKSRAVTRRVKCENCSAFSHNSCATKGTKKCCENQSFKRHTEPLAVGSDVDLDNEDNILNQRVLTDALQYEISLLKNINKNLTEEIVQLRLENENLQTENYQLKQNQSSDKATDVRFNIEDTLNSIIQKKVSTEINKINQILNNLQTKTDRYHTDTIKMFQDITKTQFKENLDINLETPSENRCSTSNASEVTCQKRDGRERSIYSNQKQALGVRSVSSSEQTLSQDHVGVNRKLGHKPKHSQHKNGCIDLRDVSTAILQAQTAIKSLELQNLNGDNQSKPSTWPTQKGTGRRGPHTRPTTLGSSVDDFCISAVESRKQIFVSRLNPNTTPEQIKIHLEGKQVKTLNIDKLEIQSKEIAAFRIQVASSDIKKIYDPLVWPKYTIIRPFREHKNKAITNQRISDNSRNFQQCNSQMEMK